MKVRRERVQTRSETARHSRVSARAAGASWI